MPKNKGNERPKRNEELRFLYEEEKEKKKAKPRKRADKKKSAPKVDNDKFNADNEIIIGVTVMPESKKGKNNSNNKKKQTKKNIQNNRQGNRKKQQKENYNRKKQVNKNNAKTQSMKETTRNIQEYYDYEEEDKRAIRSKIKKIITYIFLLIIFIF